MPSRSSTPKSRKGNVAKASPTAVSALSPIKKRAVGRKRVVVAKQSKMVDVSSRHIFRLLDLPNELRLKIYNFILPYNERIFLDPQNFYRPLPYVRDSYGSTFALLQLNKQIHDETTQYIYTHNTVNIIKPWAYTQKSSDHKDFLAALGSTACHYITKLECHLTRDIGDLGCAWKTMTEDCPNLEHLRLVFYHTHASWAIQAAQIAHYVQTWPGTAQPSSHNKVNPAAFGGDGKAQISNQAPTLEVDLYDSIWMAATQSSDMHEHFDLCRAAMHAQVFPLTLPAQIKKVTVTGSVKPRVRHWFDRWNTCLVEGHAWGWEQVDQQPSLHGMQNIMRFVNGAAPKIDVSSDSGDSDSDYF